MATINFCYFDEKKQYYSDGLIEQRILDNIKKGYYCQDNTYRNWEEFYHFSFFRENILNWYSFDPKSKVLEVGAGLGAITGLLCKQAYKVKALELTKTRAEINYLRNKQFDNLEVVVGDVRDVSFNEKFDYIILNGVLEYAGNMFSGRDPLKQFLLELEKFSKDSTKIIIAIENRMGMKYFSGAKEDHLGKLFYGINGYKENDIAITVTKCDMEKLLEDLGYSNIKLLYPFPDYKFPTQISSEEFLLTKDIFYETRPLDQDRFDFFDENKVFNKLSKDLKTGYFSNSFLVVASKEMLEENIKNLQYVKISSNRNDEFRITTKLYFDEVTQKRWVEKIPISEKAWSHIHRMFETYGQFGTQEIKLSETLECNNKGLKLEYIEGESIEELLLENIEKQNKEGFLSWVRNCYNTYIQKELFVEFDNCFIEIFGFHENKSVFHKSKINNIDMTFDNIYIKEDKLCIIDYEWMFQFDIPAEFIFWRAIKNFFEKHMVSLLKEEDVYSLFDITQDMIGCFCNWESHFRSKYIGQLDYNHLYKNLIPIKKNTLDLSKQRLEVCNLFINTGNGFNDFERISREVVWQEINNLSFDLSRYKNIKGLRFDPIENHLIFLKNLEISIDDNNISYFHNGFHSKEGILFTTIDPILELQLETENIDELNISFGIQCLQEKEISMFLDEYVQKIEEENNRLQVEKALLKRKLYEQEQISIEEIKKKDGLITNQRDRIQEQENLIKEREKLIQGIYNTRGWKMLEVIRKIFRN